MSWRDVTPAAAAAAVQSSQPSLHSQDKVSQYRQIIIINNWDGGGQISGGSRGGGGGRGSQPRVGILFSPLFSPQPVAAELYPPLQITIKKQMTYVSYS